MKKNRRVLIGGAVAAYVLLLWVLVLAESAAPEEAGASITTMGKALWYSIVTITTVGYGDAFPVTGIGKIIGALFLLMSAGALTALISFGVSWFTGTGLPRFRIRRAGSWPQARTPAFPRALSRTSAVPAAAPSLFSTVPMVLPWHWRRTYWRRHPMHSACSVSRAAFPLPIRAASDWKCPPMCC